METLKDIEHNKISFNKLDALELFRFFGALAVVVFHFNKITGSPHNDVLFPFYSVLSWFYINGGRFVEAFFLISGFTFFYIYERQISSGKIGFKKFLGKRIIRLYPLYWFATVLTLALALVTSLAFGRTLLGIGGQIHLQTIIPSAFGINMVLWPNAYPFLGPAWTVGIEMLCYIIFFGEMKYVKGTVWNLTFEIGIILLSSIIIILDINYPILNVNVARGIYCFFGGVYSLELIVSLMYTIN